MFLEGSAAKSDRVDCVDDADDDGPHRSILQSKTCRAPFPSSSTRTVSTAPGAYGIWECNVRVRLISRSAARHLHALSVAFTRHQPARAITHLFVRDVNGRDAASVGGLLLP